MSEQRVGIGNRMQALRAMAQQDASPAEARIAREKLHRLQRQEDRDDPNAEWRKAWADQQEHERLAEQQARGAREAEIAAIVRRWEHGTFNGLSVSVGASAPKRKYGR